MQLGQFSIIIKLIYCQCKAVPGQPSVILHDSCMIYIVWVLINNLTENDIIDFIQKWNYCYAVLNVLISKVWPMLDKLMPWNIATKVHPYWRILVPSRSTNIISAEQIRPLGGAKIKNRYYHVFSLAKLGLEQRNRLSEKPLSVLRIING